ncbi:retropepsin-like aspartic protease family protein [Methylocystis parvus]|uniref:TIGR02281 family clan AA aspartic protease n=1 Tax=Methylocystis parvus TaxID=134 RepID=A0A6B8M7M1_9HYPH|nr:TIGR02281 family clan AA aspartic protease [Methylocystis parvus]QGM98506.1 TIGR02281 family clan AA aspartic protease [Methylocystis parvus]WBK01154.1 TIGR02281 family clan AA aspartic protease [Methylocystis parvus OBBP]
MFGTLRFAVFAFVVCIVVAKLLSGGAHLDPRLTAFRAGASGAAPAQAIAVPAAPMRAVLPVRRDEVRIAADRVGQYSTDVEVNGARLYRMMVDTGATLVALSYEDAAAAGLYPAPADYKYQVNTANGVAHVARVRLNDVRIGNIVVHDVDAVVGERGALSGSLLGMTFLSKLQKFSIESGALVLQQ